MVYQSHREHTLLRILQRAFSWFVKTSADKEHLEVERKFALSAEEAKDLVERLESKGYSYSGTAFMTDTFLPVLNAGEMMRVRQEGIDDGPVKTVLTFKRWVPTNTGKERREAEREVRSTVGFIWAALGRMVKGAPLLRFSKARQLYDGTLDGKPCTVSIDRVEGLGEFSGWYLEVEVIVPLSGDPSPVKESIFQLVSELFGAPREDVKRSYQEMLRISSGESSP